MTNIFRNLSNANTTKGDEKKKVTQEDFMVSKDTIMNIVNDTTLSADQAADKLYDVLSNHTQEQRDAFTEFLCDPNSVLKL